MTDQCKNCELRGDIKKCLAADCFHHENWYARVQQERIDKLKSEFGYFIHQYGCECEHPACRECKDIKEANELME